MYIISVRNVIRDEDTGDVEVKVSTIYTEHISTVERIREECKITGAKFRLAERNMEVAT